MSGQRGRSVSPRRSSNSRGHQRENSAESDDLFINSRQLEAFGRTVHATASQLISANFAPDHNGPDAYRSALSTVHRSMRRPMIQRSVFSFAKANPRELIRSNFNTQEIEQRALTWLPDDLLKNVPQSSAPYSLLDGFKASLPESDHERLGKKKRHSRHSSKGLKLLEGPSDEEKGPPNLVRARREKNRLDHRLEMMGVRKTMCASEIREIDNKIANLNDMRRVVLDRLAGLEQEETDLEQEIADIAERLEDLEVAYEEEEASKTIPAHRETEEPQPDTIEEEQRSPEFMSESVYEKIPKSAVAESPRTGGKRRKQPRRTISMPVLHEHMEPGSRIRQFDAHSDMITALDFDAPWGTLVTAGLDDTVRVWDLNAGRCIGLLEGHLSSVRCLQVEENLVATGSMDASIKLWDLNQADYTPPAPVPIPVSGDERDPDDEGSDNQLFTPAESENDPEPQASAPEYHGDSMADCHVFTLSAHVAEVTALHFHGKTLVSGSADKTLRQWDLEKGRCVQTLDVLWAAAQASTVNPSVNTHPTETANQKEPGNWWRPAGGRLPAAEADFVGALQVFETALACGTADGMVRLWDLRSGMVHRSLVGHTGPVTSLQFDDVYLVTGSQDRSIRIWDLRTGNIHDAFAYDGPITSMHFDARRIVAAAQESVVKVYDKTDGRQWDCGPRAMAYEETEGGRKTSIVERVRIKDGYMVEGRKDGVVGVWSC